MTAHLRALRIDAEDPPALARFWSVLLGRELVDEGGPVILPGDASGFRIGFAPTGAPKSGPNQVHLHLTSTSLDDQQETVDRALRLGARHLDVGQRPEEGHIVLADPEGNELCVIEPGNSFLAGCGFLGELACDGAREVGQFWSAALGWPLVWDQDEETAVQSPLGGTKIAWGGPPVAPRIGRNRMRFDLAPPVDGDQQAEVERLLSLGATRASTDPARSGTVAMADPGGNEFGVLAT